MSLSPLTFTGVSSLSTDLQTVLTRAVSIASIPLKRLQNQDTDTLQKKTLLGALSYPLADLGNAVAALGKLAAKNAIAAKSSDTSKVSVVNNGASSAAVYSISNITSVAKAATETSVVPGFTDSTTATVSANGSMKLVVGTESYPFTLTTNNLTTLRDKINSLGVGVTASILTTDGGNFLSVSASATGETTLQLIDDPGGAGETNILTSNNQGSNARFLLNNLPVNRKSNTVNDIINGITFTVLDTAPTSTVSLTLATDRTQLSSSIQDFATKYNAVLEQVNAQIGPNAGLLSGEFLVREVKNDLQALGGYQASGVVKSLSDLGIGFDSSGKVSFDSAKFSQLSDSTITGAFGFFGSTTSGFGKLANKFTQLTDPITGLIKLQQDSYDATDRRLQTSIADMMDRITAMQKSVSAKLQVADALLAQLESQQKMITASITASNFTLYGKPAQS